jgi:hypothetical protein
MAASLTRRIQYLKGIKGDVEKEEVKHDPVKQEP